MEESTIELFVRKYSSEDWVVKTGFIKKEEYYQFNRMIKEQLKTLENDSVDSMIENVIMTDGELL
jgi:hypothetical protein